MTTLTRADKLRQIRQLNDAWVAEHDEAASAAFDSSARKGGSDYNVHHVELDADGAAQDAFEAAARAILDVSEAPAVDASPPMGLLALARQSQQVLAHAQAFLAAEPDEHLDLLNVSRMPVQLRKYWLTHEAWSAHGAFDACVRDLREQGVPGHMVEGACANLHKEATGEWPGQHRRHKGLANRDYVRDDEGKFADIPGVGDDAVSAVLDKLKLGKRAPAGFSVRSSKKLKTDYADIGIAEVDSPDGPQVRVGIITAESGRWDAGFGGEARKVELRQQLAEKQARFDSDEEQPDELEDEIAELENELEDLDNERTAILTPGAMADFHRQLGESLELAKANKTKQNATVKALEDLDEQRDEVIAEFSDHDLERRISRLAYQLRQKQGIIKSLERKPNAHGWSDETIAELLVSHRAKAAELEAELTPLLARRAEIVPPEALAQLEDLDRQYNTLNDADIDDIITSVEVPTTSGGSVRAEIWGSDDEDSDWVSSRLFVLGAGETTDDAENGDEYASFRGLKGLGKLIAGLEPSGGDVKASWLTPLSALVSAPFFARVAQSRLRLAKYDPAQTRDDKGRWASGGGSLPGFRSLSEDEYATEFGDSVDESVFAEGRTLRLFSDGTAHIAHDLDDGYQPLSGQLDGEALAGLRAALNASPSRSRKGIQPSYDVTRATRLGGDLSVWPMPGGGVQLTRTSDSALIADLDAAERVMFHDAVHDMAQRSLPDLRSGAENRSGRRFGRRLAKYDPLQKRDEDGKWSPFGGVPAFAKELMFADGTVAAKVDRGGLQLQLKNSSGGTNRSGGLDTESRWHLTELLDRAAGWDPESDGYPGQGDSPRMVKQSVYTYPDNGDDQATPTGYAQVSHDGTGNIELELLDTEEPIRLTRAEATQLSDVVRRSAGVSRIKVASGPMDVFPTYDKKIGLRINAADGSVKDLGFDGESWTRMRHAIAVVEVGADEMDTFGRNVPGPDGEYPDVDVLEFDTNVGRLRVSRQGPAYSYASGADNSSIPKTVAAADGSWSFTTSGSYDDDESIAAFDAVQVFAADQDWPGVENAAAVELVSVTSRRITAGWLPVVAGVSSKLLLRAEFSEGKVKRDRKGRFATKSAGAVLSELDDLMGKLAALKKHLGDDENEHVDNALDYLKDARKGHGDLVDAGGRDYIAIEDGTYNSGIEFNADSDTVTVEYDGHDFTMSAVEAEEVAGFLDEFREADGVDIMGGSSETAVVERTTSSGEFKAVLWENGIIEVGLAGEVPGPEDDNTNLMIDPSDDFADAQAISDALEELAHTATGGVVSNVVTGRILGHPGHPDQSVRNRPGRNKKLANRDYVRDGEGKFAETPGGSGAAQALRDFVKANDPLRLMTERGVSADDFVGTGRAGGHDEIGLNLTAEVDSGGDRYFSVANGTLGDGVETDEFAILSDEQIAKLRKALPSAAAAASEGRTFNKVIHGEDNGDIRISVDEGDSHVRVAAYSWSTASREQEAIEERDEERAQWHKDEASRDPVLEKEHFLGRWPARSDFASDAEFDSYLHYGGFESEADYMEFAGSSPFEPQTFDESLPEFEPIPAAVLSPAQVAELVATVDRLATGRPWREVKAQMQSRGDAGEA